jgi:hypothetical protein
MIPIQDYIKCYENILDPEVCKKIVEEDSHNFNKASTGDGIIDSYRNCYIKEIDNKFDSIIFKGVAEVLRLYSEEFENLSFGLNCEDTGYEHLLYKGSEKGEYKEHVDHYDLHPRTLSCSIILNDDYDGGDFSFFDGELIFPKKAGTTNVFPSNFCFPHAVTPVTNGNRHSIVTWFW